MEEIGYDITDLVREKDYIELMLRGEQRNRLYIIPNMSEESKFCPQTRKEIGVCALEVGYLVTDSWLGYQMASSARPTGLQADGWQRQQLQCQVLHGSRIYGV